MTTRTPPTQPFKVLKISGDSSTSLDEIRDKGEEIHAESHESAARIWCSLHEASGPAFYVQAEPDVVEFDLCIGRERRHIEISRVGIDPSAGEDGTSYLVGLHPRTGVITVRYDDQIVYQGQPDAKLAALFDEPMFVTAGRVRSR